MSSKEKVHPKPLTFASESKMPYFTVALATTEWNETGTWRYLRPRYVERVPACQHACPTSNNIETWIRLFEKGDVQGAWDAATLENPFPAIMGRVCFHPCMDGCNRRELGGSVNINMLERALADACGSKLPVPKPHFASSGKKVAVIGSGPAGLAAAYHLARFGHKVTVFERQPQAGGMLRYGIPEYRLPKNVLDREIERLTEMGIEFLVNKPIRDAAHLQEIKRDYGAVFIGTGAWRSKAMGIPNERSAGIMPGLEFLKNIAGGKRTQVGKKVIVVGGGNTAVDTARTARRLGADVTIVYRRSRAEMPAFDEEVKQAEEEGVKIEMLYSPLQVVLENGKVKGLECQKMKLGEPDESGRRKPVPVDGDIKAFEAHTIMSAIGEEIDTSIIPSALPIEAGVIKTRLCGRTEWASVFAGGDCVDQPRTVVDALGAAKRSAIAIDCFLRGEHIEDVFEKLKVADTNALLISRYVAIRENREPETATAGKITHLNSVVRFADLNAAYFEKNEPNAYPIRDVNERLSENPFAEIHLAPSEEAKKNELERCFHCGRCTECDNCYIYCPDVSIAKIEGGFEFDHHFCKGCGVCSKECPRAAIEMIEEPTEI